MMLRTFLLFPDFPATCVLRSIRTRIGSPDRIVLQCVRKEQIVFQTFLSLSIFRQVSLVILTQWPEWGILFVERSPFLLRPFRPCKVVDNGSLGLAMRSLNRRSRPKLKLLTLILAPIF